MFAFLALALAVQAAPPARCGPPPLAAQPGFQLASVTLTGGGKKASSATTPVGTLDFSDAANSGLLPTIL